MTTLLELSLEAVRKARPSAGIRGINLIGVVGSVARGDETDASDVDVVYDVQGRSSLLVLARALLDLQRDIGRSVDLVDIRRVDDNVRQEFERDLVRA